MGVTRFVPVAGAGQADCRDTVVPECLGIGLALDERDLAASSEVDQAMDAVQEALGAIFSSESVVGIRLFDLEAVPDGAFSSIHP